jgi:Family of unknown function (DUF6525)
MAKNSTISTGSYSYASKDNQWKAYERLPPSVRRALQDAAFDWASYPIWRRWNAGKVSTPELVKAIAKWDADQIKRDRKRIWG